MNNDEKKTSLLEDIPTALAAGVYGVPKSLIAGYLVTKFLHRNDERDRKIEIERQRVEAEDYLNDLERKRGRTREFLEMLGRYEAMFGPRKNTTANRPSVMLASEPSNGHNANAAQTEKKITGKKWPLFIGILFMPYIFSWFTLREGYSKNIRVCSFVWMVLVLFIVLSDISKH